jgi:hypothetical protein
MHAAKLVGVLSVVFLTHAVSHCSGQLVTYSNAAAWRTAIGEAATLDIHEGFDEYQLPTDVSQRPTSLAGGEIVMNVTATEGHISSGCMVTVALHQKALQLLAIVDAPGHPQEYDQYIDFHFTAPICGLGFGYSVSPGWARVIVDVFHDTDLLGSWVLPEGGPLFTGFTSVQGATKLRFRAGTQSFRPVQVYFSIDDIEGATVPAPGVFSLTLAAAAALRRRR